MPNASASARPLAPSTDAAPSWWQLRHPDDPRHTPLVRDTRCDVVVIGGGVTGCSAAWHLAQAGRRVVLLEARSIASGASGRNGGFLLAGLAHRPVALAARVGATRAAELYDLTVRGRERVFETARTIGVPDAAVRTGSLRAAVDDAEAEDLAQEAQLLRDAGVPVELLSANELPRPLAAHMRAGLRFPGDGRLVPARWVRALGSAAADTGAAVHVETPVVAIDDDASGVAVRTQHGTTVRADHAIVATEAWLPSLVPQLNELVLPYRSQVLAAAAPVDPATGAVRTVLPHVTWSRRGWDYAQQTADGIIIIGGERDEDVSRLRSWDEVTEPVDQAWLETWLTRVLDMPTPEVRVRWAGVLSQTVDGFPYIGALPGRSRVLVCGGWGGAGNVLGFVGGERVARIACGTAESTDIPVEMRASRVDHMDR